ncbi:hypothetical protein Pmar_PMAR023979 [Perkinsus marinus ATCC 50983]|uniref:Peptidase A1 domain-containing protein n=1 Tax=Perkinsus marinus (strain ATCC 50983 / TXsc) TaxID=423536 RepID=C5L345_PERM5|nr:hypothetical protein Pmar_PMAR023979 [Perkinsus marinus ATCC 50983]EER08840.1 hypothetical protein Pmar_PMAR023979 [Perkinsus marinus ATCC 50983]|eukprot:XP_002777024.1 hypothetical protein Pmar_PMAR023979 [Perkinsus marinus ATCC 50983]
MPLPLPIRLLALVYALDVLKVIRGKTLKLDVKYKLVKGRGFGLFHTLVDEKGQKLDVFVDTGSGAFFLIWKDWFERATGHRCSACPMGCYKCSKRCSVGSVTTTINFAGGYTVSVFPHEAKLTVGQVSQTLTLGLIFNQTPAVTEVTPLNLMGIGYDRGLANFPSLMTQLRSSHTITTDIIALYLYPSADPKKATADGGLLLGGGDSELYEGALKYVEFSRDKGYIVNINKLQVGDGHIFPGINVDAILDTGTNLMYAPGLYYDRLIENIKAQTNEAAGTQVDFKYDRETWVFPCQYMTKLPLLQFGLGPQGMTPFSMTYMHYARRFPPTVCRLVIMKGRWSEWIFPDRMLINNYFQFDPTSKRVGIGKLRPRFP